MQVAAVILAAGASSRFGEPKQLVSLEGQTLLERTIKTAQDAGCSPIVVVTGAQAFTREDGVEYAPNEEWQGGIGTSIRAGLRAVSACDAAILMTCDQPLVRPEDLRKLIEAGAEIAAAEYAGTLGIPALFASSHFPKLLALADDQGAKTIILAHADSVAKVPMPAAAIDIDTPAQLAKFTTEQNGLRQSR